MMAAPRWSRRDVLHAGAVALGGALLPTHAFGAQRAPLRITPTDLGGGLTLLQGAGANVVAVRGLADAAGAAGGALVIDGGRAASANALLSAITAATGNGRVHTLINTHWHPAQTGLNEVVGRAGGAIVAHEKTTMCLGSRIYASVDFTGRLEPLPAVARPGKSVRGDGTMDVAGHTVDYGYLPAAHTDGDLFVHLPKQNLLIVGGVTSVEEWPLLDWQNGAWLGGRVRAMQRLADLVTPDTRVVAATGRLMTGRDIVRQRDIYLQLFETMIGYLNMGLGPEDAPGRKPLKAYEADYGNADVFAYGALRSMMIAYVPD
jgi:glyoxylase-like metal-dependent hydrolase (beta-lactamase superfamily II)